MEGRALDGGTSAAGALATFNPPAWTKPSPEHERHSFTPAAAQLVIRTYQEQMRRPLAEALPTIKGFAIS
jgi:hypothetical protein